MRASRRIRQGSWVLGVMTIMALAATECQAGATKQLMTAVLPFASVSVDRKDLAVIADGIRKELHLASFQVVETGDAIGALEAVRCGTPEMWGRESCMRAAAHETGARLVLSGTVNAIGELIEATVRLYDVKTGSNVFEKTYKESGTVENFYVNVPPKVAADLPAHVAEPEPKPTPKKVVVQAPPQGTVEEGSEAIEKEPPERDFGVSPSLSIGLSGLFAMGSVEENQSPYAFKAFALYPTSEKSHARLRVSMPSFHNDDLALEEGITKSPDVAVTVSHEWCLPGFGIGVGASYLYMAYMRLEGTRSGSDYSAYYDPAHSFNLVLNLRGGRPSAAFFGRISYPLPYIYEDNEPDNYLVEYSAFGVFGGKRLKAGLGVTGSYKHRDADRIRDDTLTYEYEKRTHDDWAGDPEYYDYALRRTTEYALLVPCLRMAGLLGEHVVLGLTFELRGTILPRFVDSIEAWRPSIGFDVVYSLGSLKGANVMDGTF